MTIDQHNTAVTMCSGSEQHAFVLRDLASVNRSLTPWLVVGGHRPFYIDSTNNMEPDGDQPVATALREAFEEAFFKYQVPALPAQRTDRMRLALLGAVFGLELGKRELWARSLWARRPLWMPGLSSMIINSRCLL